MSGAFKASMWGFPHSNEPDEIYEGEPWVGVTLKEWRLMIRLPMKGGLRSMKPRVDNKHETQTLIFILN
ncbi:MAG: hypothetical protein QXR31_01740 [Zestosphaera sp.]